MINNGILNEIHTQFTKLNRDLFNIWASEIVFSWRWWINLVLTIIPWIIWIKNRDKNNTLRLLFTGLVVATLTEFLDIIGISYGLWHYDWILIPLMPIYFPWDFSLFPVSIMFFLQVKPKISPLIKALLYGIFSALLMEPLFEKISMYHTMHWNKWYSFILYIPLYLLFNWIYNTTEKLSKDRS